MKKVSRLLAFAGLAICSSVVMAGNIALITHPSSSAVGITAEEAARIYMGKSSRFGKNARANPVDQRIGSPARKKFYEEVVNLTDRQVKVQRSRMMFSGKGRPPKELDSDIAVKNWIASNPNSLGYVDGAVLDNSVKILLIIP